MARSLLLIVCLVASFAVRVHGQDSGVAPVRVAAGTVLNFHLQTRLKSGPADALGVFAEGTVLRVKMLDSIDTSVNRDGDSFRGLIMSPLVSRGQVIIHPEAEAHGLLALLRSQGHPQGFRYELFITGLVDHGQSYVLTASLDSMFAESSTKAASTPRPEVSEAVASKPPVQIKSPETGPN